MYPLTRPARSREKGQEEQALPTHTRPCCLSDTPCRAWATHSPTATAASAYCTGWEKYRTLQSGSMILVSFLSYLHVDHTKK